MNGTIQIRDILRLALLLTTIVVSQVHAADYFVDQNHPNANDSNPGTIVSPWKTIAKANLALMAGDTVYIKTGTYSTYIAPSRSGTASSPITYRNYGGDTITISNSTNGILLDGKSYIVVQGINFTNLDSFLVIQNSATHNIIAYCNFSQGRNMGWSGSAIINGSSYNWVHDNQFSKYGSISTSASGSVLDIGTEESSTDNTMYNLIENNTMFHGGHHVIGIFGKFNVVRNNYFHNESWSNGYGYRVVYVNGLPINSGWNLIEGNRIGYAGASYTASINSAGLLLANTHNILRKNSFFYNDGSGIAMSLTASYISDIVYNKIYNNSFLHNGWDPKQIPDAMTSAIGFGNYGGSWIIKYNSIKNNIFYDHYQMYGYYHVQAADQTFSGNWNDSTHGDPKFVNASKNIGDPTNASLPDLHLLAGSPCIDAGTYLTNMTSAAGSGTVFQVQDAGYFVDGWSIVQGDTIQLFGTTQRARITNINYSTNTITVDRVMTWTQGQGISLGYEGAAPDIGAYEDTSGQGPQLPAPTNLRIM